MFVFASLHACFVVAFVAFLRFSVHVMFVVLIVCLFVFCCLFICIRVL